MLDRDTLTRKLTERATITLHVHEEDIPVRGNALASGDDEEDRAHEDAIIARLDSGDIWAWCCVEVRAEYGGFRGSDFLGACSYRDEADFRTPGGYFDDMKAQAIGFLADEIINAQTAIENLEG